MRRLVLFLGVMVAISGCKTGPPRLDLDRPAVYNFGVMAFGAKQVATWRVSNLGGSPLKLRLAEKSCACTTTSLAEDREVVVPPRSSFDVRLEWKANRPRQVSSRVKISTNDPATPELLLGVDGKVTGGPEPIARGRLGPG